MRETKRIAYCELRKGGVRANAPLDAVGNRVLGNSKVSAYAPLFMNGEGGEVE